MFNQTTTLKGNKINFRKWKVKDKKKFISIIKEEKAPSLITDALVYDCLEKPEVPYSADELKYLLLQIRVATLGDELDYEFECSSCMEPYDYTAKISEIFKEEYSEDKIISSKGISFEMGNIRNKQYYLDTIEQCPDEETKYLADFMFHVAKINDNDAFTFDKLYDTIQDLDVDVEKDIFNQWDEIRFTVNDIHAVECPFCGNKELLQFDDLPEFFPTNWFE